MGEERARVKKTTIFWITGSILLVVGAICLISWITVMAGFKELERTFIQRSISGAQEAVADRLNNLIIQISDWSVWDDSYAFIADQNEAYIRSNLTTIALDTLQLDLMLFLDVQGKLVHTIFTKEYDPAKKGSLLLPAGLKDYLSTDSAFLAHVDEKSAPRGIILLPDGPMMMAARPIVKSDGSGPIRGTIIFAKFLDQEELSRLSRIVKAEMSIQKMEGSLLPQDFFAARNAFLQGEKTFIGVLDSKTIAAYSLLKDLSGRHNLILRVVMPREITQFGEKALGYFILALLLVGMAFGTAVYLPLEREIVHKRQTEQRLLEFKERFEQVTTLAREIIWEVDPAGKYTYVSPAVKEILGYDCEELVGRKFLYDLHPDDGFDANKRKILGVLSGHEVFHHKETVSRAKNGRLVWLITSGLPVFSREGALLGFRGADYDITHRKQAEEALKQTSTRLSLATRASGVGVWEFDFLTTTLLWNDQMFELYGFEKERFQPTYETWLARVHPDDLKRSEEEFQMALRGEKEFDTEFQMIHHDQSIRNIRAIALVQRDHSGNPLRMIGTNWDITLQKKAQEALMETNRALEEATTRANEMASQAQTANIAKSEFLANMSHEIRTPLNGIIGMTGFLLDSGLNPEQRSYAEIIHGSGESLLNLVNDILDFSKIEAGKLDLETLDFDLSSLLEDFAATLAVRAHEKGLELISTIDLDVPTLLQGDPGRLRQLLANIAGNAVKFTPKGEVFIRVTLLERQQDLCRLRFSVRDTGIGIPPEKVALLFDKFSQVDTSTTRKYGGTGLGLAISKQLAELMGGEVGVRSREGEGSEFWFTARFEVRSREAVTEPCLPAKLQDVRVLIVDDNAANQEILTIRLGLWGMRPLPVSNGPDALLALSLASDQNDPFRIALIDMQMPGMDGATLGQTIKADNRIAKTHLVMLTSLGVRGTARTFEELGFAGYATKPIRPLELRAILSLVLAGGNSVGSQTNPIATRHTVHEKWNLFVGRKARVLIAEDNITNQKVALGILKRLGLHADAVANGEEALKALETLPYDVVLMDIQMPLMDGLEATRRIRQPNSPVLNPEIPIIAMTAHAMQGDRERCLNAGMNDFLSKPISPLPLLETLEKWFPAFSQTPSTTDSLTPSVPHLPEEHEPVPEENRPVFDKREMMARLGFKEELVHDILETFLQSAAANLEKLKGFIAADDLRNAGLIAHSMSGAAANISCWGIRAVARKMENAAREGDIADVKNCLPELERLFSLLQKELQQNHE